MAQCVSMDPRCTQVEDNHWTKNDAECFLGSRVQGDGHPPRCVATFKRRFTQEFHFNMIAPCDAYSGDLCTRLVEEGAREPLSLRLSPSLSMSIFVDPGASRSTTPEPTKIC